MSDYLVFVVGGPVVGGPPPRLRRYDAEQLARELERVTIIDGGPLPGTKSAAALLRAALERGDQTVDLEDPELRAVYGVIANIEVPLAEDLRTLRDAIGRALDIPAS